MLDLPNGGLYIRKIMKGVKLVSLLPQRDIVI